MKFTFPRKEVRIKRGTVQLAGTPKNAAAFAGAGSGAL
jgi:hypothetical protein